MVPAEVKPIVSGTVLDSLDVRVGTIEALEEIANSSKLVRLQVNFGSFRRTILAGLKKERAHPQELQGKQALFVVNIEPKKMMGEISAGMLFDIGCAD